MERKIFSEKAPWCRYYPCACALQSYLAECITHSYPFCASSSLNNKRSFCYFYPAQAGLQTYPSCCCSCCCCCCYCCCCSSSQDFLFFGRIFIFSVLFLMLFWFLGGLTRFLKILLFFLLLFLLNFAFFGKVTTINFKLP